MKFTKDKIKIDQFSNVKSKEVAYLLGFLWADGYIRGYVSKTGIQNWKVSLEINSDDAETIFPILSKIGTWAIHKRKRNLTWKETWTFSSNHKELFDFLTTNDYSIKSTDEPTKILKLIPEKLHIYFWKGYFDGDGSCGLLGRGAYFEIASSHDYKYSSFISWLATLGLTNYHIYRSISKKGHKSSVLKIYGKEILKLYNVLPNFGLKRKNLKLTQIKKRYENKSSVND